MIDANKLIEALEENDFNVRSYSGRGMFGDECVGVALEPYESEWNVAKALFSECYDGEFSKLKSPRSDSLGLGTIIYWPSIEWPKERNV